MGNGPSDEDVMQEIEQSLGEYKLYKKKGSFFVQKKQKSSCEKFITFMPITEEPDTCVCE